MWQVHAPLWGWAIASILLGLGFTFFSGATEAWLVDALAATGFTGRPRARLRSGPDGRRGGDARRLGARAACSPRRRTSAVPYIARAAMLGRDPRRRLAVHARPRVHAAARRRARSARSGTSSAARSTAASATRRSAGSCSPPRSRPGSGSTSSTPSQPYLLQLYGDPTAYGIAGLAAALVAGAQIVGGLVVSRVRRLFRRRTDALILGGVLTTILLVLIGLTQSFVVALVLLAAWCMVFAIESPLRQAFINGVIPSEQRATVLSFDSLMGSAGGVVAQPALGRAADVYGYAASYVIAAGDPGAGAAVRPPGPARERRLRPDHDRRRRIGRGGPGRLRRPTSRATLESHRLIDPRKWVSAP